MKIGTDVASSWYDIPRDCNDTILLNFYTYIKELAK